MLTILARNTLASFRPSPFLNVLHSDIFVSGVSPPIAPWPNDPTLSAAVLLSLGNVERLGRSFGSKNEQDRQRRIFINHVILFRLSIRCQYLAFDHDRFRGFVTRHWGVSNASPQRVEELVDVYSKRRRAYSQYTKVKRNCHEPKGHLRDRLEWTSDLRDRSSTPVPTYKKASSPAVNWEKARDECSHQFTPILPLTFSLCTAAPDKRPEPLDRPYRFMDF
ncbi:hypothetical protein CI238_06872 [Colletotrichum incanum]|uniref:Uncharacterized protein n=1 Tax=Colletotrichum incanum TaxID=1573173 RepID=A0A166ZKM8_COLIC|nr:hypothetical protein CI238_06872 [Colletotrichum incanum]